MKRYLSNPPVLVPPRPGSQLLLYLSVAEDAFGCVLGQHNEERKKERAIYYLNKKFTACEPMPTGKLAKWQMLLSEFDIVYIAQKVVKGQALADLLDASPVNEELKPLCTHFPYEGVLPIEDGATESYTGWRLFFDGAVNYKGSAIGVILISENGQHYPMAAKLKFHCTKNMVEYEACVLGLQMAIDMNIDELLVI
ncbi:uncharacterized protein LOC132601615 [Lycium barbarum]|uniref:uncharacterized protein LOC132601615 n=1 Tax=Lycium barbarum TaxID=112863 RepID=UPI00293EFE50|nr:uncharacterized protein LOC132601615 [Lycium barbarum]